MVPKPISPYAVQKLTGEYYIQTFTEVYGLETVSLRYFNVFGPRQDANSQYSARAGQVHYADATEESPTIFGDGEQSRDFTFIDNVVKGNLLAASAPAEEVAAGCSTLPQAHESHSIRHSNCSADHRFLRCGKICRAPAGRRETLVGGHNFSQKTHGLHTAHQF